jgi:predicted  nucleic acid-binding Zn-ribbon protein
MRQKLKTKTLERRVAELRVKLASVETARKAFVPKFKAAKIAYSKVKKEYSRLGDRVYSLHYQLDDARRKLRRMKAREAEEKQLAKAGALPVAKDEAAP